MLRSVFIYSAEWGPCINCYQCEMCFSTRCQLTINDSDRKTEVGRGQPFFPLIFLGSCLQIIVPPIVYIVAFFSCCRHPFPFPPSSLLIPSQVVQWRPSSHYWGLIGCVRLCALPHAGAGGDTQRRDGEDGQTSARDAARGRAVIGQRGRESPRDSVLSEGGHVKKLTLLVLPHLFEFDWNFDWKFEINISKHGLP